MKRYVVRLEAEERRRLEELASAGKAAAYKIRHANVLLAADESPGGPGLTDEQVSRALGVSVRSVEYLRRRLVEEGLDACLRRKPQARPGVGRTFDGEEEAKLV